MNWTLPGTTLTASRRDCDRVEGLFQSMLLTGGLTLGQVATITGLEPYTVQNWVKRGFLTPPRGKKYDLEQLCRIVTINMLKGALPLDRICSLLSYINGDLADEADDIIDDTALYFTFVRLAARARDLEDEEDWAAALEGALQGYREPYPGARRRIVTVLRIMITAWIATRMRQEAEFMLSTITKE